jgi:SAM-dependent methyltransferase
MDELYGAIHGRMVERSSGQQGVRPTAAEFIEALERTSIGRAGPMLDAGCGGTLTFSIACANRGFTHVHAIDLNQKSLQDARALIARVGRRSIHLSCGSVSSLPFCDQTFSFVVCSGVAHHTPQPEDVVRELARVMKAESILYLSLYCFAGSGFEWIVRALRRFGSIVPFRLVSRLFRSNSITNNFVLDHMYVPILWIYRAEEVRLMLDRQGFAIAEEWPSTMDPFARRGILGRILTGDGLLRVWVCTRR